eukprot:12583248-Ditylum_brightwellii.AAC.1
MVLSCWRAVNSRNHRRKGFVIFRPCGAVLFFSEIMTSDSMMVSLRAVRNPAPRKTFLGDLSASMDL